MSVRLGVCSLKGDSLKGDIAANAVSYRDAFQRADHRTLKGLGGHDTNHDKAMATERTVRASPPWEVATITRAQASYSTDAPDPP